MKLVVLKNGFKFKISAQQFRELIIQQDLGYSTFFMKDKEDQEPEILIDIESISCIISSENFL